MSMHPANGLTCDGADAEVSRKELNKCLAEHPELGAIARAPQAAEPAAGPAMGFDHEEAPDLSVDEVPTYTPGRRF